MPPPRTITDSDADTSPISPSASSVRPSPPPTTIALGASRKRSASSDPTSADHPSTTPEPEEQLSEEAKAEEKRAKQIEAIKARNKELADEVEAMEAKLADARGKLKNPAAAATVKAHIKRLHAYNEIRDVGQGLIGLIAEQRGVRIGECYDSGEFGVGAKD
ncbi:hypothetical protein GMDG_06183 [Pseudogymnoascus destructans 20631-21]|uniref:Swi5-domain-containing protein n=1 Tax=Pseudogymnoascus destructans (strain ATCC MYA-4855 / 20631-21) TaxID=658429 RepID=L8FR38_PSED2|nr:hypothetical protein GMDG_06183 [Pseudogymnoascus destructans 20631-21]